MSDLNYFNADSHYKDIAQSVLRDGYAIVESLAPHLTAQADVDLRPHIDAAPFGHTEFLGYKTRRIGALPKLSTAVQQMIIHDLVMHVCDQVLLSQCASYQLNFTGIMQLHPGERAQVLHRDGILYPFRNPHPPTMVQAMWAVTDFSHKNGGTLVVPQSNLWEDQRVPLETEIVSTQMPKGSLLLYQSGTIHGAGTNLSDATRTGISIQYSLGWLRQEENQHLSNPPEVAKHYPPRLQQLVGYDFGGPYLGFVNGDDPKYLLNPRQQEGPPARSRPEIDQAQQKINRFRFGDIDAIKTPSSRSKNNQHASKILQDPKA